MSATFDRQAFLDSFGNVVGTIDQAVALGEQIAASDARRIVFVGCGAPNRAMSVAEYWIERTTDAIDVRRYYPAELTTLEPPLFDEQTVVLLGSHSGTTKETVRAAEWLRETPSRTIAITQHADSPLATLAGETILYGASKSGYFSFSILSHALVGTLLERRAGTTLWEGLIPSLRAVPDVLADVQEACDERGLREARELLDDRVLYTIGSGPGFSTAYVYGRCILMEMQWLHCQPVEAAEFFHGPFEVVDEKTPLILFVGEDPSRPLAERAVAFARRYSQRVYVYDSREWEMRGVSPDARQIVAPFVLLAGVERMSEHMAVLRNHPLKTRRYMGVVEY